MSKAKSNKDEEMAKRLKSDAYHNSNAVAARKRRNFESEEAVLIQQ